MQHPFVKKKIAILLVVAVLFSFGMLNTASATEQEDADDENLSFYVGNPDYRIENGVAINLATNAVENCRSDARSVIIPNGVEEIASVAFSECEMLQSVIVPEGVRKIGGGAFMGCKNLTSITLPTTLDEIEPYAFFSCDFDTLIIPRNTRFVPNLGRSEWYGVLDACKVKTLVFCGTDGLFLPTTFGDIEFPADGSGRIVFWGGPPEYIEVSDLQFNYKGGEVESGPFTICYPAQYASKWAPNGETEWNGLPIRALPWSEEQKLIQCAPKLFSDEDRTDVTRYPGWSFDQDHNVTIYSEEGWYRYCIVNWGMEINDLRFVEGVRFILEYFNVYSDEGMYPGPSEITMKRLLLPKSLEKANLNHMITQEIVVAEGSDNFRMDDGKLVDIDRDEIVWPIDSAESGISDNLASTSEDASVSVASPTPAATPESTAPVQEVSKQDKAAPPITSILLISAIALIAVAAIAVAVVLRKRKR
ncbi:MAG: leucine-rich repeat domain-containing protein [Clostridiales bacterium]|nr:leucine-rich repeat domain-containing protein [Clostridiales bacterium]